MPISYADACSAITREPSAVIFLDTCILLDIVRSPIRDAIDSASAKIARSLIACTRSSPRSLWLVTSATVEIEWQENITGVLEEVEREIRKNELKRRHLLSAAEAATDIQHQHGQAESALALGSKLKLISESLLDACFIIEPEDKHSLGAMNRVKKNLPPAKRGKAEPKDCEIYELFLSLCRDLRKFGMAGEFIFLSSNTKEYGQSDSDVIKSELASVRAKYAPNLGCAAAVLDGSK